MNAIEAAIVRRVGKEPELKTPSAGKPWASINICVGDSDEGQWVRVAIFGERAQQLVGQLHKADKVYVEGRLKLKTWTAPDGQQRTGLDVAAWKVERLGEIGRNKPAKPKPLPKDDHNEGVAPGHRASAAARDWQRPAEQVEAIPF
jgi:single-stranded DNA-binding protein